MVKCFVYDKLLKSRQSFWTTLYKTFNISVSHIPLPEDGDALRCLCHAGSIAEA